MAKTNTTKWAIFNKKTGKIAYTRESGYHRKAEFTTRRAARTALSTGRVLANQNLGEVRKVPQGRAGTTISALASAS